MIICSSVLVGTQYVNLLKKRRDVLYQWIQFMQFSKQQILMYKSSVDDIKEQYIRHNDNYVSMLLHEISNNGVDGMLTLAKNQMHLDELEVLREFFSGLGKSETGLQVEQIDRLTAQMMPFYDTASTCYATAKKGTYKISLLTGIGISILLW